uniref:Uncharacterized protein n=1 Tax=Rhipicephalus microplus TaxID=6941 RepID=A0A6G5AGA0_RHIMP
MKRCEGQQLRPLILQAWSSLARHYMAVSTAISERLAYPSMCCTLNTKKLCEKFASSGRIFLHKRFLKLWERALKKLAVSLTSYNITISCYPIHCFTLAVKLGLNEIVDNQASFYSGKKYTAFSGHELVKTEILCCNADFVVSRYNCILGHLVM